MMRNASIADFNGSDGLPPFVVQKLNANFHAIANALPTDSDMEVQVDDEIVRWLDDEDNVDMLKDILGIQ